MKRPTYSIKNTTPSGRVFIIFPDDNRLEWEATDEIGPIGIPLKNGADEWMDLLYALKNDLPFKQYLNS